MGDLGLTRRSRSILRLLHLLRWLWLLARWRLRGGRGRSRYRWHGRIVFLGASAFVTDAMLRRSGLLRHRPLPTRSSAIVLLHWRRSRPKRLLRCSIAGIVGARRGSWRLLLRLYRG